MTNSRSESFGDNIKRRYSRMNLALRGLFLWYHCHCVSMQQNISYLQAENVAETLCYNINSPTRVYKLFCNSEYTFNVFIIRRVLINMLSHMRWALSGFSLRYNNHCWLVQPKVINFQVEKTFSHIWDECLVVCFAL